MGRFCAAENLAWSRVGWKKGDSCWRIPIFKTHVRYLIYWKFLRMLCNVRTSCLRGGFISSSFDVNKKLFLVSSVLSRHKKILFTFSSLDAMVNQLSEMGKHALRDFLCGTVYHFGKC